MSDAPTNSTEETATLGTETEVPGGASVSSEPSPVPQAQPEPESDFVSSSQSGVTAAPDEGPDAFEADAPEVPSEETVIQSHFAAPATIRLDKLEDDETFLVRSRESLEDILGLATDIARLGQLFPIDVRVVEADKLQIVSGFRRVAALRFLQREKVVARIHEELSDVDATLMSLATAIHSRSVDVEQLAIARERLQAEGRLTAAARDMLDKALATESSLAPENVEEEVDADELAADVTMRLGQCNQDLSLLADVFESLDDERKNSLLEQLRYSVELVTFLEKQK